MPGSRLLYRIALAAGLAAAAATVAADELGIAARVDGVEIGVFRLERHFEDFLRSRGRDVAAIRNPIAYKRLKRAALDELIDRELLCAWGRRHGVEVAAKAVDEAFAALESRFPSAEAFQRRLGDAGFDRDGYRRYLGCDLLARQAFERLGGAVRAEAPEVERYLERHPERFVRPAQVHARHLLLRVPTPDDEPQVRAQIADLHRQAASGRDFADLARQYSQDATAARGGDLGYFAREDVVPEFAAAAFALAPGALSDPVRSRYGWHLIRIEATRAAAALPRDEALAKARAVVEGQLRRQRGLEALDALRADARIERVLPL